MSSYSYALDSSDRVGFRPLTFREDSQPLDRTEEYCVLTGQKITDGDQVYLIINNKLFPNCYVLADIADTAGHETVIEYILREYRKLKELIDPINPELCRFLKDIVDKKVQGETL